MMPSEILNNERYVYVKNFLDDFTTKTISLYFENKINRGEWVIDKNDPITGYSYYADPLIEVLLNSSLETVQEYVGEELYPTYSYSRIYLSGEELKPHIDRPSCEISITVNVAQLGESSPVYMKSPGKEFNKYFLEPGDALIYYGCEVEHWREKLTESQLNVQFMMHYVKKNGRFNEFKFDKRLKTGLDHNL